MGAREKIQSLTNGWYSLAVISSGANLLINGLGIFSITWSILSLAFVLFWTWWIGKKLLNRSSLMRSVCILLSVVGSVLGMLGIFGLGKQLFEDFHFSIFIEMALVGMGLSMNVKTFRTLIDKQVKAYFA